jgi:Holliday junction resolvase
MSYAKKVDANQADVVQALRKAGCTIEHLHAVGRGCPDLLCAIAGEVFLIEVKDGAKAASAQKLTPDQIVWHAGWGAEVHVVNSVDGALAVAARYRSKAAKFSACTDDLQPA